MFYTDINYLFINAHIKNNLFHIQDRLNITNKDPFFMDHAIYVFSLGNKHKEYKDSKYAFVDDCLSDFIEFFNKSADMCSFASCVDSIAFNRASEHIEHRKNEDSKNKCAVCKLS